MKMTKTQKMAITAVFLAMALLLPQVFHVFPIPNTGNVFLPMHIPVILCGYIVGPVYGLVLGAVSPILSFLLTGMPNTARLPFMICELAAYGLTAGLTYNHLFCKGNKTIRVYASLILTMICGRVAYFIGLVIAIYLLHMENLTVGAVMSAVVLGLPGIIIQFIFIPAIIFAIDKLINQGQVV